MLSIDGEQFDSTTLFSYSPLQTILEKLCNANKLLQDRVDLLTKQIEAKAEPVKEAAKEYTFTEVRTILAEKSRAGHTAAIKKILVSHGAEKLSEIDPSEYAAIVAEVEVLE